MALSEISSSNVPVKIWSPLEEVESAALTQLRNTASLPWVAHHVAVMPDVHYGIGATVGSVVAMLGAVSPAAVGVDIGCFVGSTRVQLLNGDYKTLEDMARENSTYLVYSRNEAGEVVSGRATALKTRMQADLMRVTITQSEYLICTPDQKFMLKDGTYREAQHLHREDLMPFLGELGNRSSTSLDARRMVIATEMLVEKADVYCLQVETYHNFALAAGVFVHNCGMAAIRTNLRSHDLPHSLLTLRNDMEAAVPVAHNGHSKGMSRYARKSELWGEFKDLHPKVQDILPRAQIQMGTLGGGNHFIEICIDTEKRVWLMLHSGSRNIGKSLAEIHISAAKKLEHNQIMVDRDLAVFLAGTKEMQDYRRDLYWAQRYAAENRQVMISLLKDVLTEHFPQIEYDPMIACHHNYVSEETHFGDELFVTRKGAISARKGELGIIPGSMGTKSYIVSGLGCEDSFCSASHGAGRKMSRGEAKRRFTRDDLERQTAGVECRKDGGVLDEIPSAYKNIDQVMENQSDLVEIVHELKQVLCIKG